MKYKVGDIIKLDYRKDIWLVYSFNDITYKVVCLVADLVPSIYYIGFRGQIGLNSKEWKVLESYW